MASWTCLHCMRRFARRNQPHECAPAMTIEEYFSTGPERERPVFDSVLAHVESIGTVHVEPVAVGIFLKRARTFAELRPKVNWVELSFALPRVVEHAKITRRIGLAGTRTFHFVRLRGPEDVDVDVKEWLTESYLSCPG
ncbi:MAG TPA: DUF5655 domain-containing protein [Acidimicrobiales bacterium]|jgi:hypothetical protein|nr:DUF5655 domain-containing protein [Acidimicrobiales bacterium]